MDVNLRFGDNASAQRVDNAQVANINSLTVSFGGFSPMALTDAHASSEQVAQLEKVNEQRRIAADKAAALERARIAKRKTYTDAQGTQWTYAQLDNGELRIEGCQTQQSSLTVPASIEGAPVTALHSDAIAQQDSLVEIICHDDIYSIGKFAFRSCANLKRLVLPKQCAEFDMTWVKGCHQLEDLTLSGQLAKLPMIVFNDCPLKKLSVGAAMMEVEPGAFGKSMLEYFTVDADNAFLKTDGVGLYTADGKTLLALAVPQASYKIMDGCTGIAKKGLSTFEQLERVELPQSLQYVGDYAFSRTSVEEFIAPASLLRIGESAFFNCKQLRRVRLNEGLQRIDDAAFRKTGLERLDIPANVEFIGRDVTTETSLAYAGEEATFTISAASPFLHVDDYGALYAMEDGEKHLARLINPLAEEVVVEPGTAKVNPMACFKHGKLRRVELSQGMTEVGEGAFRECRHLQEVVLPDSIQIIGEEAFMDTSLVRLRLPAGLQELGADAFVPYGCHRGGGGTSLQEVEVPANLDKYYVMPGMLIERKKSGKERVLLNIADTSRIEFPPLVNAVAAYAFNNMRGIKELRLSEDVKYIEMRGLAIAGYIQNIHIDLEKPLEDGRASFDLNFPDTTYGTQQIALALSMRDYITAKDLFEHYDIAVSTRGGYGAAVVGGMSVYEQAKRIIDRLRDPVFLTKSNKAKFDTTVKVGIERICAECAKHGDRQAIDDLLDLGYLTEENLVRVIEQVSDVQDATITNYLLEARRRHFGKQAFDESEFDL